MPEVIAELQELGNELKSAWEEFKTTHAAQQEEVKSLGVSTTETTTKLETINERLDELDVRMQKARIEHDRPELDRDRPEVKAFEKLVRFGPTSLGEDDVAHITLATKTGDELEKKSMQLGDDTTGGFLAPIEIVNELIKGVVLYSPIRTVANVRRTSFNSIKAPKRTQTSAAVWVGEVDIRSETQNPKFGKEEIGTRELSAMADISRQDLQDAAVDLEQLVLADFTEQFGVSEGAAFVSGDGVNGKPEGILTASDQGFLAANGIESIVGGTADSIKAEDLINVFYALKESYAANGSWLMKRSTVGEVRKLKETSTDNFLWQPGLATLAPPTILNRPYVETVDMPGPATPGVFTTGDLPVAFGDFRRGYWIVDRLEMQTIRDQYTQAGNGFIRFWAFKRVGGQVVLPEAIKLLRVS